MELLKLGTIIKTHGLDGKVKVFSTSDFASFRYQKGSKVYLRKNEDSPLEEVEVLEYFSDGKFDFVKFKNLESIDAITPFLKCDILIKKEENPLPKGIYYHDDLMKCEIYEDDKAIASIIGVEDYASYKSLRIKFNDSKKEFLLPFIETFIKEVDIENKRISVKLIPGMKEWK